ncbi:type-1B angiotensin II receptor [Electrophorus electricus]|uniref:type-1B angiotensin II receptor n=1 Tax=Electrophorus electricus TaxID=8005 RepID=UPI0015CFC2F0|nr:type-1B angiotensin II receptor [Electrophorus electricus]
MWSCLRPSQPWSIGSIGVLNLAICDLAYLVSMTPWAIYMSADYNWRMGHLLCILMNILYFVGLTSSTMFICAISADRLLAIVFPLESRMIRTTRNSVLVSLLLWAISALLIYFSYPSILYRARMNGIHICGVVVVSRYNATEPSYNLLSFYSIQVFVPLLLIIPSYLKIMARMKQSRHLWGQVRDKTILFIMVFIANFLICWVPGQVLHIVACLTFLTLNNCENTCWVAWVVNLLVEASELLYCLNACLDPLIFYMHQPYAGRLNRAVGWVTSCGQRWLQRVRGKDKAALAVEPKCGPTSESKKIPVCSIKTVN